jgi:hypothetical protein
MMLTETSRLCSILLAAALAGCSSTNATTLPDARPALRPGVEDSNQVYKGTPSANETAFWVAVRNADDAGRATVVSRLVDDITADPSNGYSEFLIAASHFMAPSTVLRALADGTTPPAYDLGEVPYLREALAHLTDPFYLGFAGGLLASIELASGNVTEGGPRFATAVANNHVATGLILVIGDLQMRNAAKALEDMYAMLEYCNAGPLDRTGGDAVAYVAKANTGVLAQRECYSGYHAPHGTTGELLILADLNALNGKPTVARTYYDALQGASDYATWALKPLVERRRSGAQAPDLATVDTITTTCATCHTNTLP